MDLPPFKIGLVVTNFSMLSFLIVLIVDHYKSNNNVLSWSSYFHVLCLIWLFIRGAFWLRTVTSTSVWGEFSFYSLYWLPNPIQFGSFMLLPLFFTQILYPDEWKRYWVFVRPLYYLILLCLVIFQILWAMFAAFDKQSQPNCIDSSTVDCFHTEYSSKVFRAVTAICFILLALCQGVYALKIANLENSYYQRYFILNPKTMAIVHIVLVFSFLTKGLYQIFALFGHFLLPDIPLQGDSDINIMVFLSFEIWEYIPTILLVLTVTSKALAGSTKRSKNVSSSSGGMKTKSWPNRIENQQAQIGNSEVMYGSFSVVPQDDIVSVSSDSPSFSSSFEKSVQLLVATQKMTNLQLYSSSVPDAGRFEKPSSLNPKSSWLPARSGTYFEESKRSFSAGHTPESPFSFSQSHSASKKSDQYIVSLRQQMQRGGSLDFSISAKSLSRPSPSKLLNCSPIKSIQNGLETTTDIL